MRNFLCKIGEKKWDSESAQKDIAVSGQHDFAIEHVTLWNIDKRLDDYMDSEEHVLNVRESRMDYLRLGLDEEKFVNALNANALVGL